MIGLILMLSAAPVEADPTILMIGNGASSCATAFQPQNERNSINWIAGFWSALDFERGLVVGHSTDLAGIVGETKLACEKAPSDMLITATYQTFEKLRKLNR